MVNEIEVDKSINKQIVGNIGLYYLSYELSKRGWNVIPTSRNAKGVDLIIYNHDATKKYTLQIKALSKRNPVPLGKDIKNLMGDFFAIFRNPKSPEVFITTLDIVKERAVARTNKEGKTNIWLQIPGYEEFKDNWDIIGRGDI
jgi:NRPS condensation-like uncharacterized protein